MERDIEKEKLHIITYIYIHFFFIKISVVSHKALL